MINEMMIQQFKALTVHPLTLFLPIFGTVWKAMFKKRIKTQRRGGGSWFMLFVLPEMHLLHKTIISMFILVYFVGTWELEGSEGGLGHLSLAIIYTPFFWFACRKPNGISPFKIIWNLEITHLKREKEKKVHPNRGSGLVGGRVELLAFVVKTMVGNHGFQPIFTCATCTAKDGHAQHPTVYPFVCSFGLFGPCREMNSRIFFFLSLGRITGKWVHRQGMTAACHPRGYASNSMQHDGQVSRCDWGWGGVKD